MLRLSRLLVVCAAYGASACDVLLLPSPAAAAEPVPVVATDPLADPIPVNVQPRGGAFAGTRMQVWVDLSMPAIAGLLMPSARAAYAQVVNAQQELMSPSLRALGAIELARLRLLNSSIAVELPADAVDAVRQLPGMIRVRPIIHRYRIDPPPPTQ